jgi:hypothetical protein
VALAARVVAEVVGYAIIAMIERGQRPSLGRARAAWLWLTQVAEAPPGLELLTPDGSSYTGVVFVERSRAVLLLALHHPPTDGSRAGREGWSARPLGLFDEDELDPDER